MSAVPRVQYCGKYKLGHDVHFIQARLSWEQPKVRDVVIESVEDDGTIRFTDQTTTWNHDPERLRALVAQHGVRAELRVQGILGLPHEGGSSYLFSVSDAPTPCDDGTSGPLPGESIADELLRRGGVLRPGRQALAELGIRSSRSSSAATGTG
jgi:hypothetical protein